MKIAPCLVASLLVLAACGGGTDVPPDTSIRGEGVVSVATVYESISFTDFINGERRDWLPMDVAASPTGELWVVQRAERLGDFSDFAECPTVVFEGTFAPNDCGGLLASTATISAPGMSEPATASNGRVRLIEDSNALHFMRRPSAIAFGDVELRVEPGDPGTLIDPEGSSRDPDNWYIQGTVSYTETFATCIEHRTANASDGSPFIGPTLWSADPDIYNGEDGVGGNGSHLDMVHATQYCMGLAYEGDNTYWLFNGELGSLDRYDFNIPHVAGHHFHGDAEVGRYFLEGAELARVPNVPSNMTIDGVGRLYIADTGNGRIVAVDTNVDMASAGAALTFEGPTFAAQRFEGMPAEIIVDAGLLSAEWNGAAEPSGLALLDEETLVIANHATGHITLLGTDGTIVRTIDTGLGAGIGGLTVLDGAIYFVQMNARSVHRLDVEG